MGPRGDAGSEPGVLRTLILTRFAQGLNLLPQKRGFALVEMAEDEEAISAMDTLNGKEVDGRILNVSEARPKPERINGRESRGVYHNSYRSNSYRSARRTRPRVLIGAIVRGALLPARSGWRLPPDKRRFWFPSEVR